MQNWNAPSFGPLPLLLRYFAARRMHSLLRFLGCVIDVSHGHLDEYPASEPRGALTKSSLDDPFLVSVPTDLNACFATTDVMNIGFTGTARSSSPLENLPPVAALINADLRADASQPQR